MADQSFDYIALHDTRPTMCFECLLPLELVDWLLDFVSPRDIVAFSQTCRYWRLRAESAPQWAALYHLSLTWFGRLKDMNPLMNSSRSKYEEQLVITRDAFFKSVIQRWIRYGTNHRQAKVKSVGPAWLLFVLFLTFCGCCIGCVVFGYQTAEQASDAKVGSEVWFSVMVGSFSVFWGIMLLSAWCFVRLHQQMAKEHHRDAVRSVGSCLDFMDDSEYGLMLLAYFHLLICCVPLALLGARYRSVTNLNFATVPGSNHTFTWNYTATSVGLQCQIPQTNYSNSSHTSCPWNAYTSAQGSITGILPWYVDAVNISNITRYRVLEDTVGGYYLSGGLSDLLGPWRNFSATPLLDFAHDRDYFDALRNSLMIEMVIWFTVLFGVMPVFFWVLYGCFKAGWLDDCWDNGPEDDSFLTGILFYILCGLCCGMVCMVVFGALCISGPSYCTLDFGSSIALLVVGACALCCCCCPMWIYIWIFSNYDDD